ncbi:MAG: hypothetical protein K8T89_19325, partial [Planctomycetes bacterium]|nr:hypothetical protein [Planctomycetota bacterium]
PLDHKEVEQHARLIDAAVPIAANYGCTETLKAILAKFVANLSFVGEHTVIDSINVAFGHWLRVMPRCGLKDQLQTLLGDITNLILQGRSLETLRIEYAKEANRSRWIDVLRSLLQLSECWVYFGDSVRAAPYLAEAWAFLIDNQKKALNVRPQASRYVPLVCCYIRAVSQQHDFDAVARQLGELLQRMDLIPNTLTSGSRYSGLHLTIVEHIVLALVNDDFILGETARRWLDEDEYLVRRRIHGDLKKVMAGSGL